MITETTVDAKRRFVKLRFSGQLDHKDIWNTRDKVAAMMKENGVNNLLIDMRKVDLKLLTIDIYDFSTSEFNFFPHGTRIAALVKKGDSGFHDFQFMETVHVNSGFPFKTFTKVSEAVDWLYDTLSKKK